MKKTFKVNLGSVAAVKEFIGLTTSCDYEIDLTSQRYVINAKSIMGIFSLDLTVPVTVSVDEDKFSELKELLYKFVVE